MPCENLMENVSCPGKCSMDLAKHLRYLILDPASA